MRSCLLIALAGLCAAAPAHVAATAAAPVRTDARAAVPAAESARPAPGALAASRTIELGAPSAAQLGSVGRRTAATGGPVSDKHAPLQIGFARDVPSAGRVVAGSELAWRDSGQGRVAVVSLRSEGAAAVRLRLVVSAAPPGTELRFASDATDRVFGPFPAEAAGEGREFWSPVLEGSVASVEITLPTGADPADVTLRLPQISHLVVAGANLARLQSKRSSDIGSSGACEIDVVCVANPSQALYDAASAVAKMVFTEYGATYLCTGTAIADTAGTLRPLFFTAHHCVRTQAVADTLNTYWFFNARTCGSLSVPPYVLLPGGAKLLAASNDFDWALFELRAGVPSGVVLSGWRAEPIPFGAIVTTLHHPSGDLEKFSQGTARGYSVRETFHNDFTRSGGGTFVDVQWAQGSTELGSSGAGLFTFFPEGGYYELRGGLFGGKASCSATTSLDYFSRLDVALPVLREYLQPETGYAPGVVPVVEFYNAALAHYFITADPNEVRILDEGTRIRGWQRTGFRFLAWSRAEFAPPGATPVCRFYLRPEVGDSHFYSASPAECAEVARRFGSTWIYESPDVFYIRLPNTLTGQCPAGTSPVYRFFDPPVTNHRFTVEKSLRDDMRDFGLIQEGYGNPPDQVAMCAPNG